MSMRIVTAAVLVAAIAGCAILLVARSSDDRLASRDRPAWTAVAWPFPIDQWGEGWAFRCKAADCGIEVNLYLRPKIGFCNCQTGVADDTELDRVGDVDLVGSDTSALGPGRLITVHGMKGRSRGYTVAAPAPKSVLSLAFNNRCDVIVATVLAGDAPVTQEAAVLEFLNGDMLLNWAQAVLGL